MVVLVVIYRRHHRKPGPLALLLSTPSFPLPHLSYLVYFLCLPSSVSSSKFGIPQLLCLPLLRKLPGCVPTIPKMERSVSCRNGTSRSRPKGTLMNPENSCSTITSTSVLPHCQQRTASGRRCRMAVSDPDSGLCSKHAA